MRLPTARVKSGAGFITINAADLADHHELHEEQAPGFVDPRVEAADPESSDDAVHAAYVAAVEGMMATRHSMSVEDYRALPAETRLAHLEASAAKFDVVPLDPVPSDVTFRAAKGPRGLWYVMRADERMHPGYQTEDLANQAIGRLKQPTA